MTEERREYMRKWRADHPDYARQRYAKKKDELREYHHSWCIEHKDEVNEYNRKYRQEHPDKIYTPKHKKYYRQYQNMRYKTDPVYRAKIIFNTDKQRDKQKGLMPDNPTDYPTREEFIEMIQQPCIFCGETDWHKIGLDRIDSTKGHIRGNLQPCCKSCNDRKQDMSNEEFIEKYNLRSDTAAVPAMPSMRSLLD